MSEEQDKFKEQQNNIEDFEEDFFDVTKQDKKENKKKVIDWKNYRKPFNRENPY